MFGNIFPLTDLDYEPTREQSIAGIAAATGRDPWDVLYDHLADGELLLGAFTNYAQVTQDPLAAMIDHPDTVIGLTDRGTIDVGKKADLNVIDFDNLTLHPPRSVDDLPAGGRRVLQDATGYVATIVSGEITRRNGVDTGARPGRLVRATH
jgi:N-acyl-D-aspartate/D-glutamate deacylase